MRKDNLTADAMYRDMGAHYANIIHQTANTYADGQFYNHKASIMDTRKMRLKILKSAVETLHSHIQNIEEKIRK